MGTSDDIPVYERTPTETTESETPEDGTERRRKFSDQTERGLRREGDGGLFPTGLQIEIPQFLRWGTTP